MIVYVDIIFLVNFIISFSFLLLIKFLLNGKESLKRIVVCSIISVVLLFSFFLNKFFFQLFKFSGGIIIVSLSLSKTDFIEKIIRVILYYIMQFSLVGIANIFVLKNIVFIFCLFFLIIASIFLRYRKILYKRNMFYKDLVLYKNNKKIKIKAYLDSGNFSNYNGKAIIYFDTKYYYLKDGLNRKEQVVNTIGKNKIIDIYLLDQVFVNGKRYKDIYIGFDELNSVDCLLNVIMA